MMKNFIPVISTVVYESKANLFKQKYKSRYFPDSFVLIVYIGTLYSGTKSCYLLLFWIGINPMSWATISTILRTFYSHSN